MNAPQQLVKQMYAGPNSALPQRLGVADTLPEDARCATSNLITGVPKQGGTPAVGQPQISAQHRFLQRQQAVMINRVLQVQKEAEAADRILYNLMISNKSRRDEGLQVMLKEMLSDGVETERLFITEVEDVRKENEEHKREIHSRKEREKEMLQKQSNLKAEAEKQYNMYFTALTSYQKAKEEQTSAEKEHADFKRAMVSQLEYLESQLSILKAEKVTLEKEHEESKLAMVAQVENLMSQLAALKVENSTLEMNAKLEVDRGSIELLWEVAEKVLTLPEDVRVCQSVHYASGYDTLLSTREENNVDKMMSFVHAALNEAAKNWKAAQADVENIKWSCQRNLVDAVLGRAEPASETTAPPKDIPNSETTASPRDNPNHVLKYISDDSENESMEEIPQKKHKRLITLTELKKRQSSWSSFSLQTKPPKQKKPRRFEAGS